MATFTQLISCSIIEKDTNGDTVLIWTYPSVTAVQNSVIMRKCNILLEHNYTHSVVCARHDEHWFYIYCREVTNSSKLTKVKQFTIVLTARDFKFEKYEPFCKTLSKIYNKSGNPAELLKYYLAVFTRKACVDDDGSFLSDTRNAESLAEHTDIRGLIELFELKTILIYTALLLKKRVVIYHHSLENLQKWIRTFPALITHRRINDYLFPWIDLVPDEISHLKDHSYYVAGCKDGSILSRFDLFDLLVNIPAREIVVATHAKDSLTMTKTHKDIALFMMQLCENRACSEEQIIREITEKTQELVDQITSTNNATAQHSNGKKLESLQSIKEKNLTPAVENFLINLAFAENLVAI